MKKTHWLYEFCIIPLCIVLAASLTGYIILVIAFELPSKSEGNNHLSNAGSVLLNEGLRPERFPGYDGSRGDNFTDSLIILTSAYRNERSSWKAALSGTYPCFNGIEVNGWVDAYVNDHTAATGTYDYVRYWHGYVTPLKVLFYFFDYSQIRILAGYVILFIIIILSYSLIKRFSVLLLAPWMISLLFFPLPVISNSLQHIPVFLITLIAMIIEIWNPFEINKPQGNYFNMVIFLISGISIAYFDLLTIPIYNLAMLLTIHYLQLTNIPSRVRLVPLLKSAYYWGFGYIGMWMMKFVLGTVILKKNVFNDAFEAFITRTSSTYKETTISYYMALSKNLSLITKEMVLVTAAVLLIVLVCCIRFEYHWNWKALRRNSDILIITALPLIWYGVTKNHSYIHYWFTYRNIASIVFVICTWVLFGLEKQTYNNLPNQSREYR